MDARELRLTCTEKVELAIPPRVEFIHISSRTKQPAPSRTADVCRTPVSPLCYSLADRDQMLPISLRSYTTNTSLRDCF
jgi:hypothetical protein